MIKIINSLNFGDYYLHSQVSIVQKSLAATSFEKLYQIYMQL